MPADTTVSSFFAANPNFYCPKLKARILRLCCFKRMIAPKPGKGTYGSKKPDNALNAYCRSGECPLGQETTRILQIEEDYLKWKRAQDEAEKTSKRKKRKPTTDQAVASPKAGG